MRLARCWNRGTGFLPIVTVKVDSFQMRIVRIAFICSPLDGASPYIKKILLDSDYVCSLVVGNRTEGSKFGCKAFVALMSFLE